MQIPAPEIFKAYDIRGIVGKTLTVESVRLIGRAIGSEARERKVKTVVVGRDGRLSGPELSGALMEGLCAAGVDVVDIGMVPTPLGYFAAHHLKTGSAVMVTGSHNPPDYNGFKIMLAGDTLHSTAITALRTRLVEGRLASGKGKVTHVDVRRNYLDRIVADVRLSRKMKIVVDCGNGVAGAVAPELFRRMGCELVELFCDVDGNFPNHHPDPSKPDNLKDVIRALRETDAELGLAFDGDGDRLGVVTKDGEIIYPDRQLMLFAADVLTRQPGAQIIFDVKCSRNVARAVRHQGGRPVMWNTGHAFIKAKLKETGAPLAGEMSGHTFFKERWYGFDDGLYAGARLLEIVSRWQDANWPLKHLPNAISTPELNLKMQEGEPHALIARLQKSARFEGAQDIITIDGLRVEYADGFGLMRASNTTPVLVLRFEADSTAALRRIQDDFRRVLRTAKPDLLLAF
ncbi:MAG: phosphomannomutase/phosphoglucomutase [Rhodocyclaceae bacterium]|nr:phosphomannomutase/phosphoglucomutase [Rhodocyclaceae bacterium]MCP5297046.1 phosphomannomutase/phosphoglucomutase [Zoogloeaceae bacterium]PKO68952.1 MAG: phosphomannomutase/phosphoglucomutase [Betaproteobacteria bacterium HGW-Betaproteobacteria-14]MBX3676841.1 phosphomannomutase/phosphoglucomutase [Rhodocyclaceae bacterium]MCB1891622.1 phosphomannomutase/phosphoglucomutase [Rhodocyclaceae bacterium]